MIAKADLRICWHGAGPVRASAWWIYPDGSTSDPVVSVKPTKEEALADVRAMVGYSPLLATSLPRRWHDDGLVTRMLALIA